MRVIIGIRTIHFWILLDFWQFCLWFFSSAQLRFLEAHSGGKGIILTAQNIQTGSILDIQTGKANPLRRQYDNDAFEVGDLVRLYEKRDAQIIKLWVMLQGRRRICKFYPVGKWDS